VWGVIHVYVLEFFVSFGIFCSFFWLRLQDFSNLLLVLLPVFFYGEYLGSFYEEAASLVLVPFCCCRFVCRLGPGRRSGGLAWVFF